MDINVAQKTKHNYLSQGAGSLFTQNLDKDIKQHEFINDQLTNLDPISFILNDNTSVCESANSFHVKIHPKDLYCMKYYAGLVSITVLL